MLGHTDTENTQLLCKQMNSTISGAMWVFSKVKLWYILSISWHATLTCNFNYATFLGVVACTSWVWHSFDRWVDCMTTGNPALGKEPG